MMATCKECLHYDACVLNEAYWVKHNADQACHAFKDKSKYVELKHGHWMPVYDVDWLWGKRWIVGYVCTACGKEQQKEFNYCPDCAAKMDGGDENE